MKPLTILLVPAMIGTVLVIGACNMKGKPETHQTEAAVTEIKNVETSAPNKSQQVCDLHKAPKTVCFFCDSSLRDSKRLWCKEHSTYEDRCFICHPEIQDKSRMYCKEHALYEDECFICHPEVIKSKN
jgi:hypothetical protein